MKYLAFIVTALIITLFGGMLIAAAQTSENYVLLAPLPIGENGSSPTTTTLPAYLAGMLKLLIATAGALAVLMMIIGGTQYVAAGVTPDAKSTAKDRITNAAIGLALTLASYLILVSINPKLVEFDLALPPIQPRVLPTEVSTSEDLSTAGDEGCSSCVALGPSIPQKAGACKAYQCTASSAIVGKLSNLADKLKEKNISWHVSEAWPVTRTHIARCQQPNNSETGKCVDASLLSNRTPANINTFIATAKDSGLRAVYEVTSEERRQQLISGGATKDSIISVEGINGEHFSVYNN